MLVLIGGGGYMVRALVTGNQNSIVAVNTPTLVPTATPSPAIYVATAEDAYWAGDLEAAIEAYQRALDIEPNQSELYIALARLLTFHGQPERGLEMAREALRRQPENAYAWALLGMAYDWLGMPFESVKACEKAVSLDPTLPEAYAYLAEAYIDTGNWFAANGAIATALDLDATNVDVLRNRGYVLENQGNYYGAIEAYREALAAHDQLVHIYMSIGRNANALNNWTLAIEAYGDAVATDPGHAPALARLGLVLLLTGDYDKAKINLDDAIEADPMLGDGYAHLGTLYFQQRNYEGAIEMFKPAIRYGEARARRRTVYFVMTMEDTNAVGDNPAGLEVGRATFVHPSAFDIPLRGVIAGEASGSSVLGLIRLDPMNGRYEMTMSGLPPAPAGKVYIGWFEPLLLPENRPVRTEPIFPAPDGRVRFSGDTGRVRGPAIETYYTMALSYYLLDQCKEATPYIAAALRLNPEDANALQTQLLCGQ